MGKLIVYYQEVFIKIMSAFESSFEFIFKQMWICSLVRNAVAQPCP